MWRTTASSDGALNAHALTRHLAGKVTFIWLCRWAASDAASANESLQKRHGAFPGSGAKTAPIVSAMCTLFFARVFFFCFLYGSLSPRGQPARQRRLAPAFFSLCEKNKERTHSGTRAPLAIPTLAFRVPFWRVDMRCGTRAAEILFHFCE